MSGLERLNRRPQFVCPQAEGVRTGQRDTSVAGQAVKKAFQNIAKLLSPLL